MIRLSDRKIKLSRNETICVTTANAQLTRVGRTAKPSQELEITASPTKDIIRIQAKTKGIVALKIKSSTGEIWETTLFPGTNLFDFMVEPKMRSGTARMTLAIRHILFQKGTRTIVNCVVGK